ncbi:MAG: protein kinase domain-containing protein [Nannocystaceae bacterium]|nr:protein kinase [bacterium]
MTAVPPHSDDDLTGILPGGSAAAQRARLVESGDEAQTVPVTVGHTAPAPQTTPRPLLLPGTVIDRYIVVEHLGSGGLGDVYKAYDPELDRRIAIKILRADVLEAEAKLGLPRDRLHREAQALAKLRHPNVVAVHDVGQSSEAAFIAMEFADGLPLHRWAKATSPSWSRVRDVFLDAGRGLAAAHAAGLVHRDFKPENVVVGQDGSVTVLDFGLARAASVSLDTATVLQPRGDSSLLHREVTSHEVMLGTPAYMAPESFRRGETSQASDQFAFCVSLYKILFGDYPFERNTVAKYVEAVEAGNFTTPNRDVPRWLVRVIARGMAARPEARFPTMEALLRALEGDRLRRKRRRLAFLLTVPLLGVAVGAGAWLWRPEPTAEELAESDLIARAAREAAARGDFVYPPAADPDAPTALSNVLELEEIEGPAAADALETAAVLRSEFSGALIKFGDRYYDMEGGRPFAADFYAMALMFDADNEHAGERSQITPLQRDAVIERARTKSFSGPELAAAEILSALTDEEPQRRQKKLQKLLDDDAPTGLTTRAALAAIVEPVRPAPADAPPPVPTPAPAEDDEPQDDVVIDLDEAAADPQTPPPSSETEPARTQQPKLAAAEVERGDAQASKGRWAAAEPHYHRALQFDRRSFGAHAGLARCKFERGQYAQAVRFAQKATKIRPRSAAAHLQLGDAHFKTLDYPAARKAYERAEKLGAKKAAKKGLDRLSNRLQPE